ncbi:hypothetical protein [Citreimonas salinaria]|uniref:Uncharacterized protein n=1 Tax=Citreimonas salinaria TaxID=321339 RepID=A0A1H3N6G5_9RHOB|nr:hypothetical protein [Citreimonas salinaria]SDY84472.1 hypothetical protein SAMN05444340_1214 [Citreimonas salinaria]
MTEIEQNPAEMEMLRDRVEWALYTAMHDEDLQEEEELYVMAQRTFRLDSRVEWEVSISDKCDTVLTVVSSGVRLEEMTIANLIDIIAASWDEDCDHFEFRYGHYCVREDLNDLPTELFGLDSTT